MELAEEEEDTSEDDEDPDLEDSVVHAPDGEVIPGPIRARLHRQWLWKNFLKIGNEMIVTKLGRY